ncbi:hypothetical protein [Vibrio sp. D431a]|uniref:hypothetical protein n=1 Tax=Vibrio sp. D431a TaxID=2837388 RepID=UPI002552E3E8|nr:hypothetical protein [Vibrio sp. D431a]MDK9790721.1 hypothetical protein [Vibrio sp. D431a]
MKRFLLISVFIANTSFSAEFVPPTHDCNKPTYEVTTDNIEQFKNDVDAYKSCLIEYIELHQKKIAEHHKIAENAITELSDYKESLF